tara:strand:- start:37 stop:375 length:339 start_codon:yes stop_codon:yes gene_type:complete
MISQYDDLTGRGDAIQDFLKMIKEKNNEDGKFEGILEKMSPTTKKVENFLRGNQQTEFMGGEQIAGGFPNPYNPAGLPDETYRSIMRQYGKKGFGPYTTEDKIRVQNFYKQV